MSAPRVAREKKPPTTSGKGLSAAVAERLVDSYAADAPLSIAPGHELPSPPDPAIAKANPRDLYVHSAVGRRERAIDDATEGFVEATRMGGG